jgi:hypothetical protein
MAFVLHSTVLHSTWHEWPECTLHPRQQQLDQSNGSPHVVNMDYRELTGIAHARLHLQPILSRGSKEGSSDGRETGYTPINAESQQGKNAFRKSFGG